MENWKIFCRKKINEIKEIQNRKLRNFITTQIYPFSPYYRKLFDEHKIKQKHIKTVEDLKIIPFTNKEDLLSTKENPTKIRDFILQPNKELIKKYLPKSELIVFLLKKILLGDKKLEESLKKEYKPIFLTATSGTTKDPISFLYTNYDLKNLLSTGARLLDVFGITEDDKAVNIFPYAPHLAFWQTAFAGFAGNIFCLNTGGGKVMGTRGDINLISKIQPKIIIGVPGYVYHLIRTAKEEGKKIESIKSVVLGASRIPLGFKEKLASLLADIGSSDVKVFGTYGFTEAKTAWGECPTKINISSGYHIYPDREIFEIIDSTTGEVKKEGEDGELVYTSIDSRGSSLIRFRTGDFVKGGISFSACPYCRRTVPRISSDITRLSNIKELNLTKVKGTLVNINIFEEILEGSHEIDEWQIEIRKKNNDPYEMDEIILHISLTSSNVDSVLLKKRLKDKILAETEVSPNEINILSREEILSRIEMETSNKAKRFVDARPKV